MLAAKIEAWPPAWQKAFPVAKGALSEGFLQLHFCGKRASILTPGFSSQPFVRISSSPAGREIESQKQ